MNSGPVQPSRNAAATTTNVYSAGRWPVYEISERAISQMTAPASSFFRARNSARAVSYAMPRMLIAGTVNVAGTSPRPRAR